MARKLVSQDKGRLSPVIEWQDGSCWFTQKYRTGTGLVHTMEKKLPGFIGSVFFKVGTCKENQTVLHISRGTLTIRGPGPRGFVRLPRGSR